MLRKKWMLFILFYPLKDKKRGKSNIRFEEEYQTIGGKKFASFSLCISFKGLVSNQFDNLL